MHVSNEHKPIYDAGFTDGALFVLAMGGVCAGFWVACWVLGRLLA